MVRLHETLAAQKKKKIVYLENTKSGTIFIKLECIWLKLECIWRRLECVWRRQKNVFGGKHTIKERVQNHPSLVRNLVGCDLESQVLLYEGKRKSKYILGNL